MCEWLIEKSPLQSWWVEHLSLVSPKPIITMQQTNMILMEEHDHERCVHISQKDIKTSSRVFKDKAILQNLVHHTQRTTGWKTCKMCQNKNKCISIQNKIRHWMKIVNKRGEVNFKRWQRNAMVSTNVATWGLKANACTVRTYSPTWASACVQHNHANGGGVGFDANSKDLWEANACAIIVCSSYNVSQSPAMYRHKQAHIYLWPFSPSYGGNDKHQEWKNKNACQAIMLDGWTAN